MCKKVLRVCVVVMFKRKCSEACKDRIVSTRSSGPSWRTKKELMIGYLQIDHNVSWFHDDDDDVCLFNVV